MVFKLVSLAFYCTILVLSGCKSNPCKYDDETCARVKEKSEVLNARMNEYTANTNKVITDLHSYIHQLKIIGNITDSIDVYIDKSNGMKEMIESLQNTKVLPALLNTLNSYPVKWYFVSGDSESGAYVFPSNQNPPQFSQLTNNPGFFNEMGSPLDSALSRITRNTLRQSIFITDGELARPSDNFTMTNGKSTMINQGEAWAKGYLTRWLKEGNMVDVLVSSFFNRFAQDSMRGFVMIFTPFELLQSDRSIKSKIWSNPIISGSSKVEKLNFEFFDYQTRIVRSGIQEKAEVIHDRVTDQFGLDGFSAYYDPVNPFQHFHFNYPIGEFQDFLYNWLGSLDTEKSARISERTLFQNLFFTSDYLVYDSLKLGIRVYDLDTLRSSFLLNRKIEWMDTVRSFEGKTIYCIDEFKYPEEKPVINNEKSLPEIQECFILKTQNKTIDHLTGNLLSVILEDQTIFNLNGFSDAHCLKIDFVILEFYGSGSNPKLNKLKWKNHNFSNPEMNGIYDSFLYSFTENQQFIKNRPVYSIYLTYDN